ncbi:MAG: hypothetical protein ACUVS3_17045 [Thermodesulfobacteriota bacterium]
MSRAGVILWQLKGVLLEASKKRGSRMVRTGEPWSARGRGRREPTAPFL